MTENGAGPPVAAGGPLISHAPDQSSTTLLALTRRTAQQVIARWVPVRIPPVDGNPTKGPRVSGWQHLRPAPDDFQAGDNIGLLLGTPSNGLTDVDLDCPEAVALAPHFLPATGMRHGRPGNRDSHWWFELPDPQDRVEFQDPVATGSTKAMLVELRSSAGVKGFQTLIPPSVHPSGEVLAWSSTGDPARVTHGELLVAVSRLAAAALLARYWPATGTRHGAALALSGALARGGWPEEQIAHFTHAIAVYANGGDSPERARNARDRARDSIAKVAAGQEATGWNALCEKFGLPGRAVIQCRDWLGIEGREVTAGGDDIIMSSRALVRAADEVDEIYREAALPRLSVGLPELERRVGGFRAGTLTTTIAPPGYGKTSLYLQIAAHCAERGPAIYWTGELTKAQLLARVVSQRLGMPWVDVLDGKVPLERAREVFASLDLHVRHGGDPVQEITAALDQLPAGGPMPAWFVDYVQIGSAANAEIRQNVMRQMRGLRDLARQRQNVGFALAQPNRGGARSLRTGKGDAASAVDLGGESGSIEQDSANVLALSIEMVDGADTHSGRLVIAKARFRGPSTVGIRFYGASGRFEELPFIPDTEEDGERKAEILAEVTRHTQHLCLCSGRKLSRTALAGARGDKKPHGTGIRKETLLPLVKQMLASGVLREDKALGLCTRDPAPLAPARPDPALGGYTGVAP